MHGNNEKAVFAGGHALVLMHNILISRGDLGDRGGVHARESGAAKVTFDSAGPEEDR